MDKHLLFNFCFYDFQTLNPMSKALETDLSLIWNNMWNNKQITCNSPPHSQLPECVLLVPDVYEHGLDLTEVGLTVREAPKKKV